jgi:hypothetical protein
VEIFISHLCTALIVGIFLCALAVLGSAVVPGCISRSDDAAGFKKERGQHASLRIVEHGRYLTDVGDCVACHTRAGGAPLAGSRAIATPYGLVYSTNITPDATGIGSWSAAQFYRAMHEGRGATGRHLFPAFPYVYPGWDRFQSHRFAHAALS